LARREFQDTEAAVELLGLRVGLVREGAVGGDHQWRDVLVDTTAEHIDAGILRLAYDRVCRFADGSHVFVRDVHRRSGEGDEVLRHRSVRRDAVVALVAIVGEADACFVRVLAKQVGATIYSS